MNRVRVFLCGIITETVALLITFPQNIANILSIRQTERDTTTSEENICPPCTRWCPALCRVPHSRLCRDTGCLYSCWARPSRFVSCPSCSTGLFHFPPRSETWTPSCSTLSSCGQRTTTRHTSWSREFSEDVSLTHAIAVRYWCYIIGKKTEKITLNQVHSHK